MKEKAVFKESGDDGVFAYGGAAGAVAREGIACGAGLICSKKLSSDKKR